MVATAPQLNERVSIVLSRVDEALELDRDIGMKPLSEKPRVIEPSVTPFPMGYVSIKDQRS